MVGHAGNKIPLFIKSDLDLAGVWIEDRKMP
jgi:hypothetical protein